MVTSSEADSPPPPQAVSNKAAMDARDARDAEEKAKEREIRRVLRRGFMALLERRFEAEPRSCTKRAKWKP
jgi:hypothetical protein